MRNILFAAPVLTALALSPAAHAQEYSGYEFAKDARISMEQASWWVLNAYPRAVITNRALERDGGQLRYVFELKSDAQPFEVSFDAVTGENVEAHFVLNDTTATGTEG